MLAMRSPIEHTNFKRVKSVDYDISRELAQLRPRFNEWKLQTMTNPIEISFSRSSLSH